MSDRIVLNPENRCLGSSSSNDFSLYGAQPNPGFSLRPADSDAGTNELGPAAASAAAADQGPRDDSAPESDATAPQAEEPSSASQPASPPAPQSPSETSSAAPALSEAPATGSLIPLASAAAALPQNPALSAAIAPAGEPLSPSLPVPPAQSIVAAEASAASINSSNSAFVSSDSEAQVPDLDIGVVAGLTAAPQLTDGVTGTVASLEPQLADVATGAFASLGPVDSAADTADDVQDLLGSDPAAGIVTLVSLVSVTDVLPVTEGTNDAGEKAEDPTADLLDALAADPVPETNLLGTDAEEPVIPGTVTTPDPPGGADLPGGLG